VLNPDDGDGSQLLCWREDYVGDKCQGGPVAVTRDQRQAAVFAWAQQAFTEEQATSLPQRGLRLLEEAIEAAQAAGCSRVMAHALVDFVFDRPPGELSQELGGVGVTVLLLAAAAGLSADEAERVEVERVLSKPLSWFAERNEAKNAAGFLAVKTGVE
jgi:NTP pyrophosphatase (non-canonical NTP hydrolase)